MKILVSILASEGWIHAGFIKFLRGMPNGVDVISTKYRPVDAARNQIIHYALSQNYDYLFMVDHDNPPSRDITKLTELKKDIIFCPTPIIHEKEIKMNVQGFDDKLPEHGLIEVRQGGTGCIMLSRKAMENISKPLFFFSLDENGKVLGGEDYNFSKKAREAGFALHAHMDYKCNHIKDVDIWQIILSKRNGAHIEIPS